jgi:hypothetical protein
MARRKKAFKLMILFGNIMLNMTQVQQSENDVFGRVVCCRANEPGE